MPCNKITRPQYVRTNARYASDLTDANHQTLCKGLS